MPASAHTLIVQPDDGRTLLLDVLAAAKSSIDLTIYEISDPPVMSALESAQKRGLTVRVLYNWYSFDTDTQQREILPAIQELTNAGISCKQAPKVFQVTHEKALVVDGSTAVVMSFNLTAEYFSSTRDFGIITTVPSEVTEISDVFKADWNSASITPSAPSLIWSPTNSRGKLASLIGAAQKTLDIYNEEADDPGTLDAIIAAAKRGVTTRFIAAVLTSDSKVNENARGITLMEDGGVNAVCKSFLYIHAKMVLVDYGNPNAQAFIGSENFSCVSLDDNRECGILVSEPAILDRLRSVYQSDWAQPNLTITPDNTPIRPCMGNPAGRVTLRAQMRS
jgi:cardiolipin synthase A/B